MSGRRPGHHVVVIGSGWAGLAAALAASEAHAAVTLIDGGPGASALGPGALDDVPWEERERATAVGLPLVAPSETADGGSGLDLAWIARALGDGGYHVPAAGEPLPLIATTGGRVRPVRAHDGALLDLARLPEGARALVPRADRPGWDADALARTWSAEPRAQARRLTFDAVDADVLRFDDERLLPDADLAARHDEPARLAWLGDRLREALGRREAAAVVLGPWLGVARSRAAALSDAIGVAAGEALAPLAATAGLRFEAARRDALAAARVRLVHGRATAVEPGEAAARVVLAMGDAIASDAVVLAIGGLVGGGIIYAPAEHGAGPEGADRVRDPVRTSVECGVRVELCGEVGPGSSTFGPALDDVAWPVGAVPGALEASGLRAADVGRARGLAGALFAAGDALARRPRTVGEAVTSGRRAGRDAAAL